MSRESKENPMNYEQSRDMARDLVKIHSDASVVRSTILQRFDHAPSLSSIASMRGAYVQRLKKEARQKLKVQTSKAASWTRAPSKFDPWQSGDGSGVNVQNMQDGSRLLLAAIWREHPDILKVAADAGRLVVQP